MKRFYFSFYILALLLAAPFCVSAQYFNQVYDYDSSDDWGYNVFVQPDNNFFIIGHGYKYSNGQLHVIAKRIRPDSSEVFTKTILQSPVFDFYRGLPGNARRLKGGQYVLPVTAARPAGFSSVNVGGLAKIDRNGDLIWIRYYTDTLIETEIMYVCNVMPDGGFLIAGEKKYNGNPDPVNFRAVLIRTDSNGNLLWKVQHPQSVTFSSVEYVGDGKILVGGALRTYQEPSPVLAYHRNRPWFIVYDTSGNLIQETLYGVQYAGGATSYIDKRGGYYHWGQLDTILFPLSFNLSPFHPDYFAKLDDSFRIIWKKVFSDLNSWRSTWNFKQLKDSNYLLVGIFNADTGQQKGWATKLDKNGNTLWDNSYYIDEVDSNGNVFEAYLVDAAERDDGSIVMTGNARLSTNPAWRRYDVWVVIVDSNGCIMQGCAPTAISQEEITNEDRPISISPNPTTGAFKLQSCQKGTLSVFNVQGVLISQTNIHEGINDLAMPSNAAAGIYIASFKSATTQKLSRLRIIYQP